jgi:hypothetical protein
MPFVVDVPAVIVFVTVFVDDVLVAIVSVLWFR